MLDCINRSAHTRFVDRQTRKTFEQSGECREVLFDPLRQKIRQLV
jgi:hypothetical protein